MPDVQQPRPATPSSSTSPDNDKLMAVLSYIGILFLIPLLAVPVKSAFLKFHLKQGIMLCIVGIVIGLAGQMLHMLWPIASLLNLVITVLAIVGIVKALQGEMWEIPVLGEYAKKINIK